MPPCASVPLLRYSLLQEMAGKQLYDRVWHPVCLPMRNYPALCSLCRQGKTSHVNGWLQCRGPGARLLRIDPHFQMARSQTQVTKQRKAASASNQGAGADIKE